MKQQWLPAPNEGGVINPSAGIVRTIVPIAICAACFLVSLPVAGAPEPVSVPLEELGEKFVLTGRLRVPLGKVVIVQGIIDGGPGKGYEGGPNLFVTRIDGVATQERIRIPIAPFFRDWAETNDPEDGMLKPEAGKYYEVKGYETGGYVGVPNEAMRQSGISFQTTGHYMRSELRIFAAKKIPGAPFTPAEFKGRKALFSGVAKSRDGIAVLDGGKWSVVVDAKAPWPVHAEGRTVEAHGFFDLDKIPGRFTFRDGVWRMVRLEDQIGRSVELRGRPISGSGDWWFEYRGSNVYVEKMNELPGWKGDNHFRPTLIRGTLERAAEGQRLTDGRPMHYVVRNASWEPLLDGLLTPEVVKRRDFEPE